MATIKKVIKEMYKKRKINGGMPIVASAFKTNYKIIFTESNLRRNKEDSENWDIAHEGHAEWLIMNELEKDGNDGSELKLLITTSPCNFCADRIIRNFNFKKIYYLFEKHNNLSELLYKEIKNIKLINISKLDFNTQQLISQMKGHWISSNLSNKRKTINKKHKK